MSVSMFILYFLPTVFQGDGTVENQMSGRSIGVDREIADTLELIMIPNLCRLGQIRLDIGFHDFQ